MQFEGKTAQYISTYYYEIKAWDEDHYKSIVRIFATGIILPCVAFIVFGYLVFFYSTWLQTTQYVTMFIEKGGNNNNQQENNDSRSYSKTKVLRISFVVSLILIYAFLSFTLFVFHIIASVKFIQYGNEVLYDGNGRYDHIIPIFNVTVSFVPSVLLISFFIIKIILTVIFHSRSCTNNKLGLFLHYSLGVFLIYLGCYFLPYMLYALIHDQIQSALMYMMLSSLILSIYLVTYSIVYVCIWFKQFKKLLCEHNTLFYLSFIFASGLCIAYFITILNLILKLGNCHDFQGVETLTFSIFIGLLSYSVFSPYLKGIKSFIYNHSRSHAVIAETVVT